MARPDNRRVRGAKMVVGSSANAPAGFEDSLGPRTKPYGSFSSRIGFSKAKLQQQTEFYSTITYLILAEQVSLRILKQHSVEGADAVERCVYSCLCISSPSSRIAVIDCFYCSYMVFEYIYSYFLEFQGTIMLRLTLRLFCTTAVIFAQPSVTCLQKPCRVSARYQSKEISNTWKQEQ